MMIIRQLGLPMHSLEEQFRRMVFNIAIRNQDDHVKNIEFLMDKSGNWKLSPAFDMTYSYNPNGDWTSTHQMSMNGKRGGFTMDDFKACANTALMKRGRARQIVLEVQEVVSRWSEYAEEATVSSDLMEKIQRTLRL